MLRRIALGDQFNSDSFGWKTISNGELAANRSVRSLARQLTLFLGLEIERKIRRQTTTSWSAVA